jgi:hypothetical protein
LSSRSTANFRAEVTQPHISTKGVATERIAGQAARRFAILAA